MKTNFFEYLDFALQFAPAGPEEKEIRAKLASIGKDLSPEQKAAVGLGMKEGDAKVEQYLASGSKRTSTAGRSARSLATAISSMAIG